MASNHQLTGVLQNRTLEKAEATGDDLLLHLADGGKMTVRGAAGAANAVTAAIATGGATATVAKVRQETDPPTLTLDMGDGATHLPLPLAEATSSVFLRDRDGSMAYSD